MPSNPTANSMSLVKTELVKMREEINNKDETFAELIKAVEARIAQLEQELKQTQNELASTKKDLAELQEATYCIDAALDDQDAMISALLSRRAGGGGGSSGTDADDEADGVQPTAAQQVYQDALKSPHLKAVIDESFRRTMATHQLRAAHLPAFDPAHAPNDQTKPLRFKWDHSASDAHNTVALERVVLYVRTHGATVKPLSAPLLKVLTDEDLLIRVTKRFGSLSRAFREHQLVSALNEKLDAQLGRAAAAEDQNDSDQEEQEEQDDEEPAGTG